MTIISLRIEERGLSFVICILCTYNTLLNRSLYNSKSDSEIVNKTKSSSSTTTEMEVGAGAALKEEKKKGKVSSFYTNFANNTSYVIGAV